MVATMWQIRPPTEYHEAKEIYVGFPTLFSIELHHGGRFTKFPGIKYIDATVSYIDLVDIDEFSMHEMDDIMLQLGYTVPPVIYYHFLLPNGDFEFGLRALGNDDDVRNLAQYVRDNKLMKVYTEHGQTQLLTYFMSPNCSKRVIIKEIETEQMPRPTSPTEPHDPSIGLLLTLDTFGSSSPGFTRERGWKPTKGTSSCSKKLCLEWEEEPNVGKEAEQGYVVEDMELNHQENMINTEEMENLEFEKNYSVDEAVMKEFVEFDPFVGNHKQEEFRNDAEDAEFENSFQENDDDGDSESSDDSEFYVDEDNIIPDVDVDMNDFYMSIDVDAEYIGRANKVKATNVDDDEGEDLEVIDNEEWDSFDDNSDNDRKRRDLLKGLGKEKVCSEGEVHKVTFHIGQKYKSKKTLKERIDTHALETKRNLIFFKNDKFRLTAGCDGNVPVVGASGDGGSTNGKKLKGKNKGKVKGKMVGGAGGVKCCWKLHASRASEDANWYVKTYNHNHTCLQTRKIKACTASFISKHIMDQVETNPGVPIGALKDQFEKRYQVGISIHKVFRAKAAATKIVVGDYTKQYEVLRDYILELQATNENTTVKLDVVSDPNYNRESRQFKRMYVCLGALKKGFKAGMRDFLGLDGAFMKGPFPGQVLTAVGVDSNNGIYPLAYAIVESENKSSWLWFLECLGDDLDLHANSNFTFISDRQKGLIPALAQIFPCAEHRFCLRHIYENMRKTWKTREYKEHLWKCATATTIPEFQTLMKEFSEFDRQAYEWLVQIPPQHWARSHFTGRALSDMLLNNLCEVFNSKLINGRDKPIISCLEFIREYLMKRICNVTKVMKRCTGPLTPTATKILDTNITNASQFNVRWNGKNKFQVQGPWHDQHVVDMGQMNCTCRKWELTGIPCRHAIATLNEMADNGETVGEIYTYVHKVHWLETWQAAYSFKVDPIKGRSMWPKSDCPTKLTHPPHNKMPGRPQKKRKQSEGEKKASQSQKSSQQQPQTQKLTRKFGSVTCSKCKLKGHNARTCKGQGGNAGGSQAGGSQAG